MNLSTPLRAVPGVGYTFAYRLSTLNLLTVEDLLNHYPFRYDDFSKIESIYETKIGEKVTVVGEIWSIKNIFTRSGKTLTQAILNDGTAPIELTWFNQSWLTKNIQTGDRLQVAGKVNKYKNKLTIMSPTWEKMVSVIGVQDSLHTGRLVPVYPETMGLTSKWIRTRIADLLPKMEPFLVDPLPEQVRNNMMPLKEALQQVHFPTDGEKLNAARARLAFDELFYIQLATQKVRRDWQHKTPVKPFKIRPADLKKFSSLLKFKLTNAQNRVIAEIIEDLKRGHPMNRLVQGEVGSGKTVVAAMIIYLAHLNGLRSYFMAPTEILAFQHYSTLTKIMEQLGLTIGIYTGSKKFTKDQDFFPDVIVGTHALLSDKLVVEDVGLIVVDEQQRFGVEQRSVLRSKAQVPHFLTMTATPIPRTVALTMYGDLDLSIIDELPVGRQAVKTHVVPNKKRTDAYKFIDQKVKEGDQVYVITPLIEESETMLSAKAAKFEFAKLSNDIFPHLKLGLLHGRLKSAEKAQVLNDFKEAKIDILVSTSVVEVGVDVANATIMLIEGSDRFGLAALHQLRGRVGRGTKESFCFLFSESEDSSTTSRLRQLEKTFDGLKLAELDLKIRGSGEIFGKAQSGRFELKIASFSDLVLIERSRNAADNILKEDSTLDKFPVLAGKLHQLLANAMPD